MKKHSHDFVETYEGMAAFGLERKTDEEAVVYYLQKFSDDALIKALVQRMTDTELNELYLFINRMLRKHLSHAEYHTLFLKDQTHIQP